MADKLNSGSFDKFWLKCPDGFMAGLNINMTDELREFVDERTEEKGFSNPTEYVRHLIREDRERATQEQLEELLIQGLQSGEVVEMTPEDWAEIRRTARERLSA